MAPVVDPGSDAVRVQRLADFINADDWREKRRLAEQDPGLASRQTSRVLEGWIDQVASQGDAEAAEHLRRYADFLTRVRTVGVSAAFEALAESAARLGDEALQRFYQSHTPDEAHDALDDAITSFAQALSAIAWPPSVSWWTGAAVAHSERYDLAGDLEDLHLAVGLTRRALQDTKPGDPARAACLVNLAGFLLDRHEAGAGDSDDVTAAEEMARQAVREARQASSPAARDQLAAAWVVQARAATVRYDQAPDPTLLQDAIAAAQSAVEAAATDRDRAAGTGSLASALLRRYELAGDTHDLDAAIAQHRLALELTASPSLRPTRLSNLGTALLSRYDRLGDLGDLDAAIDVLEQASELTPETASIAGAVSSKLGLVLAERYSDARSTMTSSVLSWPFGVPLSSRHRGRFSGRRRY